MLYAEMASTALKSTLGDSYALLEEAGVAEYVEETLQGVVDDGGGAEEIQEAVLPFLLDAGAVAGSEEGEALCAALHAQLSLGAAAAPAPGEEFKRLDAAISMGKLVKADEARALADNAETLRVQTTLRLPPSRMPYLHHPTPKHPTWTTEHRSLDIPAVPASPRSQHDPRSPHLPALALWARRCRSTSTARSGRAGRRSTR